MPHVLKYSLIACLLVFFSGCASNKIEIDTDYLESTDFSQLKTYRWYTRVYPERADKYDVNSPSHKRFMDNVDAVLRENSFREIDSGIPDFVIHYNVNTQQKRSASSYNNYGSGMAGSVSTGTYGSNVSMSGGNERVRGGVSTGTYGTSVGVGVTLGGGAKEYKLGTVFIDVLRPKDMSLMWRGIAEGKLPANMDLDERKKISKEVARDIMSQFPPK
ncbi:MAG: DUF4136 domain-containing protein [Pseudomonadales bacterium]